jgi:hypothetical protein
MALLYLSICLISQSKVGHSEGGSMLQDLNLHRHRDFFNFANSKVPDPDAMNALLLYLKLHPEGKILFGPSQTIAQRLIPSIFPLVSVDLRLPYGPSQLRSPMADLIWKVNPMQTISLIGTHNWREVKDYPADDPKNCKSDDHRYFKPIL